VPTKRSGSAESVDREKEPDSEALSVLYKQQWYNEPLVLGGPTAYGISIPQVVGFPKKLKCKAAAMWGCEVPLRD
jgi:hypothetical protein